MLYDRSILWNTLILCIGTLLISTCGSLPTDRQIATIVDPPNTLVQRSTTFNPQDYRPAATNLTEDTDHIFCYQESRDHHPTSLVGCQQTLDLIQTFPAYNLRQTFVIDPPNSKPQSPSTPPYEISTQWSDCVINLFNPAEPGDEGYFSWKDVHDKAKRILEFCVVPPSPPVVPGELTWGGFSNIGAPTHTQFQIGWTVEVRGKRPGERASNQGGNQSTNGLQAVGKTAVA